MPEIPMDVGVAIAVLPNGLHYAEAPLFPELSVVENDRTAALGVLKTRIQQVLARAPLLTLHRRVGAHSLKTGHHEVKLGPPRRQAAWVEPVVLRLDYVAWQADDGLRLAYVPALNLQVIVQGRQDLERRLDEEIRGALARRRLASGLSALALWPLPDRVETAEVRVMVTIRTAREEAEAGDEEREPERSIFDEVAVDLTAEPLEETWENEGVVTRLAEILGGQPARGVLLVGPSGVGKTAAFRELVRRRRDLGFPDTPFHATSGSRLVAGMSGFGMWQERCLRLVREASHRRAIVHLGGLFELVNTGASSAVRQGIASFLRPYLGRGELLAVVEATTEELARIEREDPQLIRAFEEVRMAEPEEAALTVILRRAARERERAVGSGRTIDEAGLAALMRLHQRYEAYSARPGRPLRFLHQLLGQPGAETAKGAKIRPAEVHAAFSRATGLPGWLLDDEVGFDPEQARLWFGGRVIGQPEAVQEVVGTLTLAKTRLARPHRPLAAFLFVGPTGVGKTEMVKALAAFLFDDPTRIVRFDMSEFAHSGAAERLAGGAWDSEGLLTARLREQPFCVVLLDEFEKAHPAVHDLLLQVLGEARLTDAAGRIAWFGNAVVILTSNLGAQEFQQAPAGFKATPGMRHDAREHFTRAVEGFLRPELANRLDGVIPFLPLDEARALAVTQRELDLARGRDGLRLRSVQVDIDPAVAGHLMRAGFDPAYGARPLKRVIERELLVPLAQALNEYSEDQPVRVEARILGSQLAVRTTAVRQEEEVPRQELGQAATELTAVRRSLQALRRSSAIRELENQIHRAEHLSQRAARGTWLNESGRGAVTRLPQEKALLRRLETAVTDACHAETDALVALHTGTAAEREEATLLGRQAVRMSRELLDGMLLELLAQRTPGADEVTVGLYFRGGPAVYARWGTAVLGAVRRRGMSLTARGFSESGPIEVGRLRARYRAEGEAEAFMAGVTEETLWGVVLVARGRLARVHWAGLEGWHEVREGATTWRFLVHLGPPVLEGYQPPSVLAARSWGGDPVVVSLDQNARKLEVHSKGEPGWAGDWEEAMELALRHHLAARLRALSSP